MMNTDNFGIILACMLGGVGIIGVIAMNLPQYDYIEEAKPLKVNKIVEIGDCTAPVSNWSVVKHGKCAVELDNGEIEILEPPVMVGMNIITCPEFTNNIDNKRCVYWLAHRPKILRK